MIENQERIVKLLDEYIEILNAKIRLYDAKIEWLENAIGRRIIEGQQAGTFQREIADMIDNATGKVASVRTPAIKKGPRPRGRKGNT